MPFFEKIQFSKIMTCIKALLFILFLTNLVCGYRRPACVEKVDIYDREKMAQVIFTGTVQRIYRNGINSNVNYSAVVLIKKVVKCAIDSITTDIVVVTGLGNKKICHSDLKERDTRLFLVTIVDINYFRLNSSLLRININNLDLIQAAVEDVPYKRRPAIQEKPCEKLYCAFGAECLVNERTQEAYCQCGGSCSDVFAPVCGSDGVTYSSDCRLKMAACVKQTRIYVAHHGQCDVKDPCEERECRFGAECRPSLDGMTSECFCPEKCPTYGNTRSSRPVCGTDGKDYPNLCELKKTACREMKSIDVRYTGKCDPCDGVECLNSQVCQLDDNRNPTCRCNIICSEDLRPVCGSDGKTYTNECTLRVEACKSRKNIRIVYSGECSAGTNPCESLQCGPFQECDINKFGIASCQCPPGCESVMRPVCGSDGQTYNNLCELQRNACLMRRMVSVLYNGQCGDTGPCHNYLCSFNAICVLKAGKPGCECPSCTEEFEPVCGTDGMSYTNECKMKREGCEQRKEISIAYLGLCNTCSQTQCEYYAVCELDNNGRPNCVCPEKCVKTDTKVCGNDGVTYMNECELRVSACTKKQYITVASRGPCDLCINVHCKHGARCEDGRCVCPTDCPESLEPVCASDGATYPNDCEMRRAACVHTQELNVLFYGECEDVGGSGAGAKPPEESGSGNFACEEEPCRFGGLCDYDSEGQPQCVCPFECPAIKAPVCGSDGNFYDSECLMKEQACKLQKKIVIVPRNRCQTRVEVPCDGEKPLANPMTGEDYDCGDEPDSRICPPNSYCHKTQEFAKCCKKTVVIKSCEDTVHGCCPDGKTAAQGPQQAGCPSQCQCNSLGSYSLTCDPGSQQCSCKPGVGGLRCDRCEPGFWGLHKVSDGSSGCTPCACDQYGSVRDDCEQMTGRCVCKHGINGMKCNICPAKTVLGPDGCMDASIAKPVTGSCDQLKCFHGATCKEKQSEAQCICDFRCTSAIDEKDITKAPDDTTVCGTDGNSYGSECQLKLFSCRYQKSIEVVGLGSCSKYNLTSLMTSTTTPEPTIKSTEIPKTTSVATETKIARDVTENPLENLLLTTKANITTTPEPTTTPASVSIIGLPLFAGTSYLELPKLDAVNAYSRLALELEVRTMSTDGILLYNGQTVSGKGDYVSLAIKGGFVEFSYNLGSGPIVLKSTEQLQLGVYHRIIAKRYLKSGMLSVDGKEEIKGESPGPRLYLDLAESLYLGSVPDASQQIHENIGVPTGFVGCIRHFKIGHHFVDLKYPGSQVLNAEDISECSDDSCTSMPCQNGATCLTSDEHVFTCKCPTFFTGRHCEVQLDPCASEPCAFGGTCKSLPNNKYSCLCPSGSSGDHCEQVASTSDESGLTLDFSGDSYLKFRTLRNVAQALHIEIWFLTRALNGLLLYNGQKPSGSGDFVALTLLNGFLLFSYNLGSGAANISSLHPVSLGEWHSVKIARFKRSGTLQVDNGNLITGESNEPLIELNLAEPFYIGGLPDYEPVKNLSVHRGLDGAIQRVLVNDEVWEDMLAVAKGRRNIEHYLGPPCFPNPCRNSAKCIPHLSDFRCHCPEGFTGKVCNETKEPQPMNDDIRYEAVGFDGSNFLKFSEEKKGNKLKHAKENHIAITFRTREKHGLMVWINKGTNMRGDYLAIAIVDGYVQLSFNLGKETVPLVVSSHVEINDNKWHTLVVERNKRSAELFVDGILVGSTVSQPGATELNTDGILWIGGSSAVPSGFSSPYYRGFRGCIASVSIDGELVHLASVHSKQCPAS